MGKISSKLSKLLLEKQISKITYQIELLQADLELAKEKSARIVTRKIRQFSEKHRPYLLALEIEQLSNDAYLTYHTKKQIEKLATRHEMKRRAILTTKTRKMQQKAHDITYLTQLENQTNAHLDRLEIHKEQAILKINARYQSRLYSDEKIKENRQKFLTAEQAANDAIDQFKKVIQVKANEKLIQKETTIKNQTEKLEVKLSRKKTALKPLIEKVGDSKTKDDFILKVNNLTMNFGGLKAVDDLSFTVKKGEIFGLIGPNGAGKTTVFNCITQFYKPAQGEIFFKTSEDDIISLRNYKVHNVIKQGIVRTFQNVELIWELSVLENMLVGAHSLYRSGFFHHSLQTPGYKREEKLLRMKAEKILVDLDLYYYKDFYPLGLPYGVLKKVELARTLLTHPSLIILDEPAAGLNDAETVALATTIKKIQKEYDTTIFLVEHDMGLVMSICDTVCAINFGKKLAIGTPEEIQNNALVKEAYLGGE